MLRRIVPATAAAALLLTGLTACGAQSAADDCSAALQPGALSDNVAVLGTFGEMPQVSAPDDIAITTSQRTVVAQPDAEDAKNARAAEDGTLVGVNMFFVDPTTGEQLYASNGFAGGSPEYLVIAAEQSDPLTAAVRCAVPGERVVVALSPEDAAPLTAQLGATADAPLVGVIDVASVSGLSVEGSARGLPAGFPAVVTNSEGRPGVVLPPNSAPSGTKTAVRIAGDGDKVTADANVIAQVLEVGWDGQEISNSWENGSPMGLGTEDQIAQSGFTYRTAITGQTVGSQLVIIENEGDEPRVLVVDVLGIA